MDTQTQPYRALILVCVNVKEDGRECCGGRGSAALYDALKSAVSERGLKGIVRVSRSGCLGQCSFGPNIMVFPEGVWYSGVSEADLPALIARHMDGAAAAPPEGR
jgi:(2Fe-2S) ferredoxin